LKNNLNIIGFKKILIGFIIIIIIALFNAIFSSGIIQHNKIIITRITKVIHPYIETLDELDLMVTRSKMLITNWVYMPQGEGDKKALTDLHEKDYKILKEKLNKYATLSGSKDDLENLNTIFKNFEHLLDIEQIIMQELVTYYDYKNETKKFSAEDILENEINPRSNYLMSELTRIIGEKRIETDKMQDEMLASFNRLILTVLATGLGLFIVVVLAGFYISKSIKEPVMQMKEILLKLGRGELPDKRLRATKDVVGDMVTAVNTLTVSFSKTAAFAQEIGSGNLKAGFVPLSNKDMLGNSLINMRNSLQVYSENLEQKVAERTSEVVEKNQKLKIAYDEIRDSINYAKRIQEAISPPYAILSKIIPQSFILSKSKDIVSGDFHWFAQKGDETIIAAVDCTGHGVPGALMTVIGNSLLNQIVNIGGVLSPGEILNQLDQKVLSTFRHEGDYHETNDGMDISICSYNIKTRELKFAGAKRPLYFIREGTMQEIKGDPFPIGSFQYEFTKKFTEHTIPLKEGDTFYLFSDGYQDQFGIKGRKFMKRRFRELLLELQPKPMEEVRFLLEENIDLWRGSAEQTDDILVIGLRF
jgi:serine phosphatase RsbU (regulator of sigma subunit)